MSERPPISPRSPRAALEPEQVPPPPKRSERARNPFVVVGNAIITILIILMIGAGTVYYYGRQMLETPGPLQEDKIVNIPARAGKRDIADVLQREGVIDVNPWVFIGSVFAMKASSDLKPGEYSFQKTASLRDVIGTIVEGKVVQHAVTIPVGLTSEQIVARLKAMRDPQSGEWKSLYSFRGSEIYAVLHALTQASAWILEARAQTSNWRGRLFGRMTDQILMNQVLYPNVFKLAKINDPVTQTVPATAVIASTIGWNICSIPLNMPLIGWPSSGSSSSSASCGPSASARRSTSGR